jgi:hypothetical protein
MENVMLQDKPAVDLDLIIGELEMELPSADLEASRGSCIRVYCI